eukprot:jgi/Mesvir1/5488/Mv15534-RA.1
MPKSIPIFCGNFEYAAPLEDIRRLFKRYGAVERVDMKIGYAFVYMEDERDADDAIHALHNTEFGRMRRNLVVERAKGTGSTKMREEERRQITRNNPTRTLFVVNFDPNVVAPRDIERHFEPYGRILRAQIRKNFAFVEYATVDQATAALKETNMSSLKGRVISVEYAANEAGGASSGGRGRSRSPPPRRRSPSPYRSRVRSNVLDNFF